VTLNTTPQPADLQAKPATIAVLGLGYVGLPLVLALSAALGASNVIGFDVSAERVISLNCGRDANGEADADAVRSALGAGLLLSDDAAQLARAQVYIVTVPTPVNAEKRPDLTPISAACGLIAPHLKRGDLVIFESTVYPGCTEDFCAPLLAAGSGLRYNEDFFLGYSPERINPGDQRHTLASIVKITSGSTARAAEQVDALYSAIITAGTFRAADIRTAEAAKVIENVQRDVNIALVNEFAQICAHLKLDTTAVLAAARSKWNFLDFRPGLVGGHCIGVDPYYLIHRAQLAGFHPTLIATARVVNEGMASHIAGEVLKLCARRALPANGAKILILGVAFKENCSDIRNSRVFDIARELREFGAHIALWDPVVHAAHGALLPDGQRLNEPTGGFDIALIAVAHQAFATLGATGIRAWLQPNGLIYDVKGLLAPHESDGRL
jgi:UDP-N-acetyl-D-glucosamine/UDP-N-acetyl-D-galactosamine dehydrogenase